MEMRILVVDDDLMIRELLKFRLSRCGFDVVTAGNEKEFWSKTFAAKPDLIILDILLRNKNGPAIYQNLVDFVGLDPGIPVVFITALLDKEAAPKNASDINYSILAKPFNFEELLGEIDRLLDRDTPIHGNLWNKIRSSSTVALTLLFLWLVPCTPNSISQEITGSPAWTFFRKPVASPSNGVRMKAREEFLNTILGTAAWYSKSDPHIRRHTANGEIFNDSKHTCAIWGVPFGTLLKVTNLENQKSVICRVNDRGPARRLGRQIDRSKSAFRSIANLRRGVIKVSITLVK